MTLENITLFQAAGAKMGYLSQRQEVISRNIANADTPGYRAHDVTEPDFSSVLRNVDKEPGPIVSPSLTHQRHIMPPGEFTATEVRKQDSFYEVAPSGNAVIIEEQMVKANQVNIDHNLMVNIMRKNVGMIRTALGVGR